MHSLGNIFLYNNHPTDNTPYQSALKQMGYYLFDTDNLHKFNLYNKEITPDVILLDFTSNTPIQFITSLEEHFKHSSTPIIVISQHPKALIYHPAISHYLTNTSAQQYLEDIINAYCIGNINHHILYINLKPYERSNFISSALQKNYKIFEVHNLKSAQKYIEKNSPQIICINFKPVLSTSKKLFNNPKTFYVENNQNIEELEQFIH